MPENFELITELMISSPKHKIVSSSLILEKDSQIVTKEGDLKNSSEITEIGDQATIVEKYGIIYLSNLVIFLQQNGDLINILLRTVEYMIQLLSNSKKKPDTNYLQSISKLMVFDLKK